MARPDFVPEKHGPVREVFEEPTAITPDSCAEVLEDMQFALKMLVRWENAQVPDLVALDSFDTIPHLHQSQHRPSLPTPEHMHTTLFETQGQHQPAFPLPPTYSGYTSYDNTSDPAQSQNFRTYDGHLLTIIPS